MPDEVISFLNVAPNGTYVDMTVGDGGHSILILERLSKEGRLIAFDKDINAIERSKKRCKAFKNVDFINEDFSKIKKALLELGIKEVDGIVFDLGVSSGQLDSKERGFSFLREARLDMRMDIRNEIDAYYLVNNLPYEDLFRIIKDYGEDSFAKSIARAIVNRRARSEIATTTELADLISDSIPKKFHPKKIHPATKTFQALRIEVNQELSAVQKGVRDAVSLIKKGGRVCVISFNSLEDRIVKRIFKEAEKGCVCPKEIMYCQCGKEPYLKLLTKKPSTPTDIEVDRNPRSRSAKLRVAERI